MLKTAVPRIGASPISQESFQQVLSKICQKAGERPRLGLAVSGGVDSMALASLCSRSNIRGGHAPYFTSLIVDHQARPGSGVEAEKVAETLRSLKLDPHVLQIVWPQSQLPTSLHNFETIARRERFRILGEACKRLGINNLLLAHHADDQAETILLRLINGYSGNGLQGIKDRGVIPECHGMYGISESGSPRQVTTIIPDARKTPEGALLLATRKAHSMIEDGGVEVLRPLLEYRKDELITTCKAHRILWIEDQTNLDQTLTPRNAARALLRQSRLPATLTAEPLQAMAQRLFERAQERERCVDHIFKLCRINLSLRAGTVKLAFPQSVYRTLVAMSDGDITAQEARHLAAMLLGKILMLCTPLTMLSLQNLDVAVRSTFPALFTDTDEESTSKSDVVPIAKVLIQQAPMEHYLSTMADVPSPAPSARFYETPSSISITRATPDQREMQSSQITLLAEIDHHMSSTDPIWSAWQLFDGRFWIRILYRPHNLSPRRRIYVRFLMGQDLASIRKTDQHPGMRVRLERGLKRTAPGHVRFTLPAIVESYTAYSEKDQSAPERVDKVLAVPSVGWGQTGWTEYRQTCPDRGGWQWEIRYKKVDFGMAKHHEFVA